MLKRSYGIIAAVMIVCAFTFFSGCSSSGEDSGSYDMGVGALKSGDYESAAAYFQAAIENDGRYAEAYRGLGIVYLEQGGYEYAINMFDLSLEAMEYEDEEFEQDLLLYKAKALILNEQEAEALEIYDTLKERGLALAYALEGIIYLKEGETEKAVENFEASISNGADIEICLTIYEAYKEVNLEGDGVNYLEEALSMEASSAEEKALLGKVYGWMGDTENACVYLQEALSEGYEEAMDMLGRIYIESGRLSEAKAMYMEAIRSGDNVAAAYNGLALCAIAEENYESALVYIEQGLNYNDENANKNLLYNEIAVYEMMLDFDTAREKAEEYLEIYPNEEDIKDEFRFLSHS